MDIPAAYQRYVQLVQQLGHEQTDQLDRMITELEEQKIASIHQAIENL